MSSIGKDVFLALAAIVAADAKVDHSEIDALVASARAAGLSPDDVSAVEKATKTKKPVGDIDVSHIGPEDRLFVYAMAYWITRVDGEMTDAEDTLLTGLGTHMELSDRARMGAEELVDEVAATNPNERFDLDHLRSAVGPRLLALLPEKLLD